MKIPDNFPIMINASLVSAQNRKRLFWTNIPNVTLPDDRGILLKDIIEDGYGNDKSYCVPATYYKENTKSLFQRKKTGLFVTAEPVALRNRGQGKKPEYNGTGKANALTTVQTDSMVDTVYQYRRTYWRETKGGKVPTLTANMGTGGHNVPFIQQTARGYNKGGKKFDKVPTLTKNAWEHNHKLNNIRKLTPIECERLQCLPDNYTEGVSNTQRYKSLGNAFNVDVVAHILSFIPKK